MMLGLATVAAAGAAVAGQPALHVKLTPGALGLTWDGGGADL